MSQKPISELRRRMLEDMAVRNFSEATIRNYIRHIADLAKFLGRSLDTATAEDVRRFQVHLTENGARPPKLNSATSAIRFFFGTTLDRPELARHLARVHYPRPLPRVLSLEEVGRLLEAAPLLQALSSDTPQRPAYSRLQSSMPALTFVSTSWQACSKVAFTTLLRNCPDFTGGRGPIEPCANAPAAGSILCLRKP